MKSDMRTKQEIRQAVAILRHKGDRISMLQAATLEEGRNEAWVFATYVTSVPEGAKDEAAFFAARDAARFAAGHIGLEEADTGRAEHDGGGLRGGRSTGNDG